MPFHTASMIFAAYSASTIMSRDAMAAARVHGNRRAAEIK